MDLWEAFDKNFEPGWTAMRLLTREGVRAESRGVVRVAPEALGHLAREAFREVNFLLRSVTLEQWAAVLDDPAAGANDRYVAAALLKNAAIAAEGALPLCQDTGTAAIIARKGEAVRTGGDDAHALAAGVAAAYSGGRLRFSQLAPLSMCDERNTGTNLPAQIEIHAAPGDQFHFLFIAKGGGSSNKTVFFQKTKSLLSDEALAAFLRRELRALGVAACPPYHLALVVGGPSPEMNLKVLKLATAGALDCLPAAPDGSGAPYRDRTWEERLLQVAAASGLGAQFGGRWLAIEARVIRCAARRQLPAVAGRLLQRPSQRPGPHRTRRRFPGAARPRPRPVSTEGPGGAGAGGRRRGADRSGPAAGRNPPPIGRLSARDAGVALRHAHPRPRSGPCPFS